MAAAITQVEVAEGRKSGRIGEQETRDVQCTQAGYHGLLELGDNVWIRCTRLSQRPSQFRPMLGKANLEGLKGIHSSVEGLIQIW